MIPSFDDLDVFLRHFSEPVLKGPAGSEVTIRAIFDREGLLISDGYAPVNTAGPKITCKTSDVEDFVEDMRFVIEGVVYVGRNHTPTGTGFSEINLFKAYKQS
jgi:arginine/ornithine N-succinyltransferase beta subunit